MTMIEEYEEAIEKVLAIYNYAAVVYINHLHGGSDGADPDTREQVAGLFSRESITKLGESLEKFGKIIELAETSSTTSTR